MAGRPVDYLNTVTSMQHILEDVELGLDRVRTEEENEWKIRYDVHARYKRQLEMRAHRTAERIKFLRQALRDGGLEYHRDYRLDTETFMRRLVDTLTTEQAEKYAELEKKEDALDRESQVLKEERQRRKLLTAELESTKLGSDSLLWTESRADLGEILKEKIDDVVDQVVQEKLRNGLGEDDDNDGRTRTFSRDARISRGRLPRI